MIALPWLSDLYRKLLLVDLSHQLPGTPFAKVDVLSDGEARHLLSAASALALQPTPEERSQAYEIASRLAELANGQWPFVAPAADVVLSRLGNFPGRSLLRRRYLAATPEGPKAPPRLAIERRIREFQNSIEGAEGEFVTLTDFQYEFYERLQSARSVSVSAPTSAGKSFVMALDLLRRLRATSSTSIVYVVPTRALIREVGIEIRRALRAAKLEAIPVRSVPFPMGPDHGDRSAVYVLTQERLMSLLHSKQGAQRVDVLIVDEAQSIGDDARGVLLQSAIEAVLRKNPSAEVHFASPLVSNPDFLLDVVGRRNPENTFVERVSPVSQNIVLVSPVSRQKTRAAFQLISEANVVDLGVQDLGFDLRGSAYRQRALLAAAVTKESESTLLFANGAEDAERLAQALVPSDPQGADVEPDVAELVDFLKAELHPEYSLIQTLPHGIAYHYGFMPSIVRARVEDLFRANKLRFVCCTSTLLQGVNLPARHIVIHNPQRGKAGAMCRKDFLNLAGRAGRLLREFNGTVWCLRPAEWDEQSYVGTPLQEIRSAMNSAMTDGGTLVHRALQNDLKGKELDFGEAVLGKLYTDFTRQGLDISESKWKTPDNVQALRDTQDRVAGLHVMLPTALLDANRAVRPDRLQALYERLKAHPDPKELIPLRPGTTGSNDRMSTIIKIVQETLAGRDNESYRFYRWLAVRWIYNTPLSSIIAQRLAFLRQQGSTEKVSVVIRTVLRSLEEDIRYRLVKYYMAYVSILELIFRERDEHEQADSLEPFYVYLECGASDRVALSLIALGLSRATALALRNQISFESDATPEQCQRVLSSLDVRALRIPALCRREIMELLQ